VTITASESTSTTESVNGDRTFRRVLGASSVSMLGSHVTTIAYPLLVLRLTGSPFTAGCVVFAATAPSMLVYIPAGALVDRWNPRRAMVFSEVGRGVAIGSVALTLALGKPIVWVLIAVAVIEGILEVFSGLAERRYVGSLVEPGQASSALVRIEARTHVVVVAGRPLGGLLFGMGPVFPFLADAASFIYSATALTRIGEGSSARKATASPRKSMRESSLASDIAQGMRWMLDDRFALMAIILFSLGTLIFQALIMVFLSDAHNRQLPALAIGIVLAASGVGGALGSVLAPRLLPRVSHFWLQIQTWIWGAGFAALALSAARDFFLMAVIMAILGLTGALGNITLDTHLMQEADKEMLARVTSIGRLASFSACAAGPLLGGVLVQELGVQPAMLWLFCVTPVLVLLSALTPVPSAAVPGRPQLPVREGRRARRAGA
jgi:MFS family permease